MAEVRQTLVFREWLDHLADRRARERIAQRIVRLGSGLMGDVKPVGDGVSSFGWIMGLAIGCTSCNAAAC
jgi:putative addiction module killer protein